MEVLTAAGGSSRAATAPRPRAAAAAAARVGDFLFFAAPLVLLVAGAMLLPAGYALFRSFYAWDPGYRSPFVGLANFGDVIGSDVFLAAIRNSAVYLLGVPIWTILPLALALLLYEGVPGGGVFRTIYFLPAVLPPAIVAILFKTLLQNDGAINSTLDGVGLGGLAHDWLNDPALVKPVLIGLLTWGGIGTGVVIFAAALSAIEPELFEAAELDGASWWQRLRHVMLPGIRSVVAMWVFFQILGVFLFVFGWIFVLTRGGPGYSSVTLDFDIYRRTFQYGQFGTAAAEAVLLTLIVATLMLGVFWTRRAWPRLAARGRAIAGRVPRPAWRRAVAGRDPASWRRPGQGLVTAGRLTIAALVAVVFLFPFAFLISTAVRTEHDYVTNPTGLPGSLTLDHFRAAWTEGGLGDAMINSVSAVGVGVMVVTLVSPMAAFWFFRHRGRLGTALFAVLIGAWVVPFVIFVIPLFVSMTKLHLTDNLVVLGLIYAATNAPFGLYLMYAYYRDSLPTALLEAAEVDGASIVQQFRDIVLPLSLPALGTLAALSFIWMWGDLLIAVILIQDPLHFTVPAAAATLTARYDSNTQVNAAAALITVAPTVIVFLAAQRAIIRGFTAGLGK